MDDKEIIRKVMLLNKFQAEVLYWTCQGKNREEIAELLKRNEKTHDYHINKVYEKFEIPGDNPVEKRRNLKTLCPKIRRLLTQETINTWPPDEQDLMERLGITQPQPIELPSTPKPSQPVIFPPNLPEQTRQPTPRAVNQQRTTRPNTPNRHFPLFVVSIFGVILVCGTILILTLVLANNTDFSFLGFGGDPPSPLPTNLTSASPTPTSMASLLLTPYTYPTPQGRWFEDTFNNTLSPEWNIVGDQPWTVEGNLKWKPGTWIYYGVGDQNWVNYSASFDVNLTFSKDMIFNFRMVDMQNYLSLKCRNSNGSLQCTFFVVDHSTEQELATAKNRMGSGPLNVLITVSGNVVTVKTNGENLLGASIPAGKNVEYGGVGIGLVSDGGAVDNFIIREISLP